MGKLFDRYLKTQEANIVAYLLQEGEFVKVFDLPSIHFVYRDGVFAFWTVGAERPHGRKIAKIKEEGDTVTLYHEDGKIELTPPWDPEGWIEAWRKEADHENIRRWLDLRVEELRDEPARMPEIPPDKIYRVMLELHPMPGDPGMWVIVGAWAANEDEIVYWPVPEVARLSGLNEQRIKAALAAGRGPLEIFQFWLEEANGISVMRSEQRTIKAPSALAAARRAVERAQGERGKS